MLSYGITDIQSKPSLMESMDIGEIVDKQATSTLGYFISAKYEHYIRPLIEKIDRDEKLSKLRRLEKHQDLDFTELGVDDGL
jgi:hypothetical protein